MIEVLCVTTKLCFGGVQTFLINNVKPLLKHDVRMNFVVQATEPQQFDKYVESLGCKIFRVTPLEVSKFKFMRDIRRIIKHHPEIQIIHSHQNFANTYSLLAAHSLPVRISHAHSCYAPSSFANRMIKGVFKLALPFIATDYWGCSDKAVKWLYGKHSAGNKCKVIKNAIDTKRFSYNPEIRERVRKQLGIEEKSIVWCHVGSFGAAKNHVFLIKLFKAYSDRHPMAKLILCGDGNNRSQIEAQIKKLGLDTNVFLLGNRPNTEDYLNAADLFVFPSLYEGFSLSMLEAQSTGIPCVTSEAVPQQCILNPNVISLKNFDIQEYINAADEVLKMDFPRKNGSEKICETGFHIQAEAARLATLYKQALSR